MGSVVLASDGFLEYEVNCLVARGYKDEMPLYIVEHVPTWVLLYLAMQSNFLADMLLTAENGLIHQHFYLSAIHLLRNAMPDSHFGGGTDPGAAVPGDTEQLSGGGAGDR